MSIIRILYINGGIMNRGGIEAFMMNYYRELDKTKFQIDFVLHGFEKGVYDDEIIAMGGKIFNVPIKSVDFFGNMKALIKIFKTNQYKIVHAHMDGGNAHVLNLAKKCGIPIRISHSHNTQHLTKNPLKLIFNEISRKLVTKYATHYFACSEAAGRWLFGDKCMDDGQVHLINNAITLDDYLINYEKRKKLRENYALKEKFVIGHIGRFDYQKNHLFLLKVFSEYIKINKNAVLVLVGDGHLRTKIETEIINLGIQNNVYLLGVRDDVKDILNMFDAFCFPSHFEGLGMVLIEAQANGLQCLASNKITTEVKITDTIDFISINNEESINIWVSRLKEMKTMYNREVDYQTLIESGYSISEEVKRLQCMYEELLNKL